MLKVMLVDDEVQIIKGMKASIDWFHVGCEVVCEAVNGKEGLEKAIEYQPHIIITDITMPVMDGIEMTERLKDYLPDTKVIFLTCHEDFHYAKQALKLNISDYIVKETMTREELYKILKIVGNEIISKEEHQDRIDTITKEFNENRVLVGKLILNDLIAGNVANFTDIEKRLDFYNYRLKDRYYQLSVLKVEKNIGMTGNISCIAAPDKFIVFNTINEILKSHYCGEVFMQSQDEFVLIYYFSEPSPKVKDYVYRITEEILENLKSKNINKCTVLIGEGFDSLRKLPNVFNNIKQLDYKRFYLKDVAILFSDNPPITYTDNADLRNGFLMNYKEALNTFDMSVLHTSIEDFVKSSLQLRIFPDEVKNIFSRAFDIMADTIEKYGCKYNQISAIPYGDIIGHAPDIFILSDILINLSKEAIDCSRNNAELVASTEIKKVIQYINLHLKDNLTLDSMASLANMNSSYFSRYFKIKSGEKFVEYLSNLRIEKAKQLLHETDMTLDEILEKVGHVNKGYFIKVFKKAAGISPAEYRRKMKNEYTGNCSRMS